MTNVEAANREAPSVQKTEGGSSSREESVSTSNTNESNKETSVREAAANTNADSEKASNGGGTLRQRAQRGSFQCRKILR